jgi:hypothetical protein
MAGTRRDAASAVYSRLCEIESGGEGHSSSERMQHLPNSSFELTLSAGTCVWGVRK